MLLAKLAIDVHADDDPNSLNHLTKMVVSQLGEINFLLPTPIELYFDFSGVDDISNSLLECVHRCVTQAQYITIHIIIENKSVGEKIFDFIGINKIRLMIITKDDDDFFLDTSKCDNLIDIKQRINVDYDLTKHYRRHNQRGFSSLDFILPKKDNLIVFTQQLVALAEFYFEHCQSKHDLMIVSINSLLQNYMRYRLHQPVIPANASLIIRTNGNVLMADNYIDTKTAQPFSESFNIFQHKILKLLITTEYFCHSLTSSINRLEVDVIDALNAYMQNDGRGCELKNPLVLFYKRYGGYIDTLMQRFS